GEEDQRSQFLFRNRVAGGTRPSTGVVLRIPPDQGGEFATGRLSRPDDPASSKRPRHLSRSEAGRGRFSGFKPADFLFHSTKRNQQSPSRRESPPRRNRARWKHRKLEVPALALGGSDTLPRYAESRVP